MKTPSPKPIKSLLNALAIVALGTASVPQASAAAFVWSGGGTDATWNNTGNWVGGTAPTFGTSCDLYFYQTGAPNLATALGSAARTVHSLNFTNATQPIQIWTFSDTSASSTARILTLDATTGNNPYISADANSTARVELGFGGGNIKVSKDLAVTNYGSSEIVFSTVTSLGTSSSLSKWGSGTFTFAAKNNLNGTLTVNGGLVNITVSSSFTNITVNSSGAVSFSSALAVQPNSTLNLGNGATFGNGSSKIIALNDHAETWNGSVICSNASSMLVLGSGTVTLNANCALSVNTSTLALAGPLSDNGQGFSLTKLGQGLLRLTGTNSYTGGTRIGEGTLAYYTYSASASGATLSNTATLQISMGDSASVGRTVSLPCLTNGTAATDFTTNLFDFGTFGNPTTNMLYTPTLAVNGTQVIKIAGSGLSVGQVTLMKYGNAYGLTPANLVLSSMPSTNILGYVTNNTGNQSIDLVITSAPSYIWRGVTNGLAASYWELGNATATNWYDPASDALTAYMDNVAVRFDDSLSPGGATTVILATNVAPNGGIVVSNVSHDYEIGGTSLYGIRGGGRFTKDGSGTLTLTCANAWNGTTSITNGTVILGVPNALPQNTTLTLNGILDLHGNDQKLGTLSGGGTVFNNGSAPVNTLNISSANDGTFSGTLQDGSGQLSVSKSLGGTWTLAGNNTYTGGTTNGGGTLQIGNDNALGTGALFLTGGTLCSANASPHTPTVSGVTITATTTLGNSVNNGRLVLPIVDFSSGGRNVTFNSDVTFRDGSQNGQVATKNGNGILTLQSANDWSLGGGALVVQAGDIVVDSAASWTVGGTGFRLSNRQTNGLSRLTLNSGASVSSTQPLVLAYTGGEPTATNLLTLNSGSQLTIPQLTSGGAGTALANFNGGTLAPADSSHLTSFLQGLDGANLLLGGLTLDDQGNNLTVAQILSGTGALTKNGSGTLTLSGSSSFSGGMAINSGGVIFGSAFAGRGTVSAVNGTLIGFRSDGTGQTAHLDGFNFGSGDASRTLQFIFNQVGNPTVPAGYVTNLTLSGQFTVAVPNLAGVTAGAVLPLLGYSTLSGTPSFPTVQLPTGINGVVALNAAAHQIQLTITSVTQLVWTPGDANWDIGGTFNWTLGSTPTTYSDGSTVLFNDTGSAQPDVVMTATLSPALVTVSNSSTAYSFDGPGALDGSAALIKDGPNTLYLGGSNTFTGPVLVRGGTLYVSNSAALGSITGATTVTNGASLDFGFGVGHEPLIVSGSGVGGKGALTQSGTNAAPFVAYDVTLAGDTTFGSYAQRWDIHTGADSDPGLRANGYNLTKVGTNETRLTFAGTTNIWDPGLGDIDVVEGAFWFYYRTTMGVANRSVFVHSNALLGFYATAVTNYLGQTNILSKNVFMTNANLTATGIPTSEPNIFGGSFQINGDCTFLIAGSGATFTNIISGPGVIHKTGGAALTLNAGNTFAGPLSVEQGRVALANPSGPALAATNVLVQGLLALSEIDLQSSEQLSDNALLTLTNPIANDARFVLKGFSETIAGLAGDAGANAHFVIVQSGATTDGDSNLVSTLTLKTPTGLSYDFGGILRDSLSTTSGNTLNLVKSGSGTQTFSGAVSHTGATTISNGTLVLNTTNTTAFMDSSAVLLAGGTYELSGTVDHARTATITGTGNLVKSGPCQWILNGANSYAGTTTVKNGELRLNGANLSGGAVTVQSGAALSGTNNTIAGAVAIQSGGSLALASGMISSIHVNSSLNLQGTVTMNIDKDSGSQPICDQIQGLTDVTFGGTLVVSNINNQSLNVGDEFQLFVAGSSSAYHGAFISFVLPDPGMGKTWDTSGLTGNSGRIKVVSAGGVSTVLFPPYLDVARNLIIRGSNTLGSAGGTYSVVTSTNVAEPLSNWLPTGQSGSFGPGGSFSNAIPLNSADPRRFFNIKTP